MNFAAKMTSFVTETLRSRCFLCIVQVSLMRIGPVPNTAQEAERHPKKHLITRAIGISAHVEVDCFAERWTQNDVLLLCSDGLTNEVSYAEMAEMLSAVPYAELADALIARANANGGHDNSTVLLLRQDCE